MKGLGECSTVVALSALDVRTQTDPIRLHQDAEYYAQENAAIADAGKAAEADLNVTEDDLLEAKELAATFSLEDVRSVSQSQSPDIFMANTTWNVSRLILTPTR